MKYIKKYESTKYINDEHKNLENFARRLQYNLNKYLNAKRASDPNYSYVTAYYNHSTPQYDFKTEYDICVTLYADNEFLVNFLNKITGKKQGTTFFYLSKDQAERLLLNLKTNFAEENAEKYNL